MDNWISVSERLPELEEEVWVWVVYEDRRAYGTDSWLERLGTPPEWAMGSAKDYKITHWQPLPDPPEEQS